MIGGKVEGGKQIIQVNEEGEEYVVNAPATRILGPGLLTKIMTFPEKTKTILKSVSETFQIGGKVEGKDRIIRVNEEGEEYVINAPATRILGAGLLTKIMTFPQKTREILSQVAFPGVDIPQPAFAFDTGGSTVNASTIYNGLNVDLEPIYQRLESIENAINRVSEINEAKELRADINAYEMAVIVENGNKEIEMRDI